VSEEWGSVCVARAGRLAELGAPAEIAGVVGEFASASGVAPTHPGAWRMMRRERRDLLLAIAISLALWAAVVSGSEVTETAARVRVVVQDLPPGYVKHPPGVNVLAVEPDRIDLSVGGPAGPAPRPGASPPPGRGGT